MATPFFEVPKEVAPVIEKKEEVFIKVSARVRPFLEQELDTSFEVEPPVQTVGQGERPYLRMMTSSYFKNSQRNFYFEHAYDGTAS